MKTQAITVLLVDANHEEAEKLCRILAESETLYFTVERINHLAEALALLESRKFDVVLADLGDSAGVMNRLSTLLARAGETPIIIITNIYDKSQALEAVRAGAQDYVQKPQLTTSALERILLYAIERHRARTRAEMQYAVSQVLAELETVGQARVRILELLCGFLECKVGQIWDMDKRSGSLICAEAWHVPVHEYAEFLSASRTTSFSSGEGLPGRALGNGEPVWVSDLERYAHLPRMGAAARAGLHSTVAFPIAMGTEILGVMELFSEEIRGPDEELLKVLANIGSQVGQFVARKLAEQEKEQLTKERLLVLDSTSEGIYGVDLKGCITFINRAAAEALNCSPESALGKNSHSLFHHSRPDGSHYESQNCPLTRVLVTGEGCRVDDEYFWKADGTGFAVEYSAFPIVKNQQITGAVVCFKDIRERRKLEVELRVAQKLDAVGRLAAGIAHEINTPIQFVGDNAHFLQDSFREGMKLQRKYEQLCAEAAKGPVRPEMIAEVQAVRKEVDWDYLEVEVPKAIEQVLDGIERVATIVRAMKEFSHVDRSSDKTATDLNKALESTLVVARNELKYVADVETEFGQLPPVVCHLGDLNQVFLNLLINAAHAIGDVVETTGCKGQIKVKTRQDGDWVEVAIQDSGAGIPEEIRDKIFDPFFTTKRVGEGTGQGLALARAVVVEKHGGTVTFETKVGRGTTFYVRLPVNGQAAAKGAAAS
ncbi:MAG TPA: ATP-binding protein [Terriglobales bacterium]|nr:ATP-binding protein [Terriglobales bacterium]